MHRSLQLLKPLQWCAVAAVTISVRRRLASQPVEVSWSIFRREPTAVVRALPWPFRVESVAIARQVAVSAIWSLSISNYRSSAWRWGKTLLGSAASASSAFHWELPPYLAAYILFCNDESSFRRHIFNICFRLLRLIDSFSSAFLQIWLLLLSSSSSIIIITSSLYYLLRSLTSTLWWIS